MGNYRLLELIDLMMKLMETVPSFSNSADKLAPFMMYLRSRTSQQ